MKQMKQRCEALRSRSHPDGSKGEATCLCEICEIIKDLREKNRVISGIVLTKKSTDETDETEMASRYALAAIRMEARAKRLAFVGLPLAPSGGELRFVRSV